MVFRIDTFIRTARKFQTKFDSSSLDVGDNSSQYKSKNGHTVAQSFRRIINSLERTYKKSDNHNHKNFQERTILSPFNKDKIYDNDKYVNANKKNTVNVAIGKWSKRLSNVVGGNKEARSVSYDRQNNNLYNSNFTYEAPSLTERRNMLVNDLESIRKNCDLRHINAKKNVSDQNKENLEKSFVIKGDKLSRTFNIEDSHVNYMPKNYESQNIITIHDDRVAYDQNLTDRMHRKPMHKTCGIKAMQKMKEKIKQKK